MNFGGTVILPELSSWWISGGGYSLDVEVGVPMLSVGSDSGISLGGGGMQIDVKSRKQPSSVSYRMTFLYGEAEIGIGGSLLGNVSVSGGVPDLPSGGTPVLRCLGAPDDSGADGPPTGFLGPACTLSANAGIGNSVAAGLLLMNPALPRWTGSMRMSSFRYATVYGGVSIGSAAAAGAAIQEGLIVQIDRYENGQPTNQRVTRQGLISGSPFLMRLTPWRR